MTEGASAAPDVAALGAAVLRRQIALGASTASLDVPETRPWPSKQEWSASGALVHAEKAGRLRVWAEYRLPSWMPDVSDPLFTDVDAALERRLSSEPRLADPFFTAITGHRSYFSDGQRLAVRAVVSSAHDSTTLVVLPTGSGKTAVAHVAALLADSSLSAPRRRRMSPRSRRSSSRIEIQIQTNVEEPIEKGAGIRRGSKEGRLAALIRAEENSQCTWVRTPSHAPQIVRSS
jgi:hypothetical protein